jgi:hypothetical protein
VLFRSGGSWVFVRTKKPDSISLPAVTSYTGSY